MLETDKRKNEQEGVEINAQLYRLTHVPVVADQLKSGGGTWIVRPGNLPLDVAFIQKGKNSDLSDASYLGINVCGKENVVGIFMKQGRNAVNTGLRYIDQNEDLAELKNRGARVLVMTPRDLRSWVGFYEQVYGNGTVEEIGEKALEYSGLEWLSQKEYDQMTFDIEEILKENWDYISNFGVADFKQIGKTDVLFVDEKDQTAGVPIFHYRETWMDGEVEVGKVLTDPVICTGMVVQRVGENRRSLVARAQEAERELYDLTGIQSRVLTVSPDQILLWQKMGFSNIFEAIDNQSEITAEDVVRFLYLGENNMNPGLLARHPWQLSLPAQGDSFSFPGVDIIFSHKLPTGAKQITSVDNLLVWDKKGQEIPLSNVAGIRIFPRNASFEEMKRFMDPIRKDLAYRAGLPGAYILNLTPELFERWQKNGSPFFNDDVQMPRVDLRKQHEYFMPGKAEHAYYFQLRQKAEIGGNKNGLLLIDGEGNQVSHLFDVGLGFKDMPRGFNGIGKDPNTADGLLRLFRTGVLPMVPGWWETEYIKQTALKMSGLGYGSHIREDIVAQFLVAELYGRCEPNELKDILPKNVFDNIMRYGASYKEKWWGSGDRLIETATPTHPHADHINLYSYLSSDIRVILSGPTAGFFNAITQKAGTWRRRLTDRKMITEPRVGNSYQVEQMDIEPYYYSGRPLKLSSQVTMEPFFVTHSVPGTWQLFTMRTRNGGTTTLFNSGDWNVNREKSVFEVARRISGRPDVIVMEGTNVGSEKAYLGRTESDVRDTLMDLVKTSENELIVAVAPINNLTRLRSIMEVAESTGRKLALSFPHSELALQLAAAKKMAPAGAEGFEDVLPYDIGNDRLTVWAKQMTSPRTFHKALIEIANRGNLGALTHERLSKENGKWIVVVSPFDVLEDQFDGLRINNGMKIIWMASFPYDQDQRYFIGANNDWIRRTRRVKFIADMEVSGQGGRVVSRLNGSGVLHVSGHATPEEMVAITDILIGNDRKNVPVIINHSENPEEAARLLANRLGDKVKTISRLDRYDPADPFNHPGFYFPLI